MIKRICFFTTNFSTHAQTRTQYSRNYLPKNVEIFFATPSSQNKYSLKNIKVLEFAGDKIHFLIQLRKFCIKNKIDLLINLGTTLESWGMLFSTIGTKTKYIVEIVGNDLDVHLLEKNWFKQKRLQLMKWGYFIPFLFAKKILFGAEDLKGRTAKLFFPLAKKIYCLDLILDEKTFSPRGNKLKLRKKLNLPLNKPVLVFVARIQFLKGSDILFDLVRNNPDKFFVIIGKREDERFKEFVPKNALILESPHSPEQLSEYYNASDLSILPSRIEGYGLVSRECMLCGTPSLVSDIPSLNTIKYALKAGLSVDLMQKEINKFFSMPKKEKEKLSKISRSSIIERNSYSNLYKKYIKLFLE